MERVSGAPQNHGFWRWLVRKWLALTKRKVRVLHAEVLPPDGPVVFAVSHPAGYLQALILATAFDRSVHCLLSKTLARGSLAQYLARHLGMILYEGERPASEATLLEALDILARGGSLLVFADASRAGLAAPGELASTAATLVGRAKAQKSRRPVPVHPLHLFLPESASREVLIYLDPALARADAPPGAPEQDGETSVAARLESRFRENAFQLKPADLQYFFADLEDVLRTGLQQEWESRADWKQDAEGFVLSRLATEWVKQTNYLQPERLVSISASLDEYRRLRRECALRELEVGGAGATLGPGWRKIILWFETVLGLPIALYGLLNHLAIGLVLLLAGSFKRTNSRPRTTEWTIRAAVTLGFYILQTSLVAHRWGRAAAGYYLPTLPVSGAYLLWRYVGMVRPRARLLFISLTIPAMKRKIKRMQHALLDELDQTLAPYEEPAGTAH